MQVKPEDEILLLEILAHHAIITRSVLAEVLKLANGGDQRHILEIIDDMGGWTLAGGAEIGKRLVRLARQDRYWEEMKEFLGIPDCEEVP